MCIPFSSNCLCCKRRGDDVYQISDKALAPARLQQIGSCLPDASINRISEAACRTLSPSHQETKRAPQILIAEDGLTNQKIIKRHLISVLQVSPQDLFIAPNGMVALEWAKKRKFDLIITDWEMPLLDGIQLTQLLRNSEKEFGLNVTTPIIGWTSCTGLSNQQTMLDAGMNGWIAKELSERVIVNLQQTYLSDFFQQTEISDRI